MNVVAGWLVQQPLHILYVALVLLLSWVLVHRRSAGRAKVLFIAALGWMAYAAWEAWVLARTPEADIRVDLLVIWPLLAILTLWGMLRAFVHPRGASRNP